MLHNFQYCDTILWGIKMETEEPKQYVCDDCGILDEDEVVWHGAGKCPNCGKEALPLEGDGVGTL